MLGSGHVLHDRYQIVQVIGQGTTGTVYLADDLQRGRPVAVRELRPGRPTAAFHPADIRLFQREAFAFQGLRHPNLSRVHEFLKGSHACYLVMDFVEGRNLSEVLADEGPQHEATVLDWVQQLCGALRYLHARRPPVILRELGPSNVVLRNDGWVRIVDFGIARSCGLGIGFDRRSGTRGMASGGFRAPGGEWLPDVLSDVYSLGALMHCLLTGDVPASAPDAATSSPRFVDLRRARPDVSEGTVGVVEGMLHPDRTARPPSIDDVMCALGLEIEDWTDTGEDLDDLPPRTGQVRAPAPPSVADPGLELFLARSIRVDAPSGPFESPAAPPGPRVESPLPLAVDGAAPAPEAVGLATSGPSAPPVPPVSPPRAEGTTPGTRPPPATALSPATATAPQEEVLDPGSLPADSEFAAAVKSALAASAPVPAAARPPKAELAAAVKGAVAASASAKAAARAASRARAQAPAPILPLSRVLLVAAVVLALLVAGWWTTRRGRTPAGPATATILEVTSLPPLARVYVDDSERGVTPLRLTSLSPGRHDVRVEHPSHVTARYMIHLREGRTRTMRVVLQKEGESPVTVPPPPPGVDDGATQAPDPLGSPATPGVTRPASPGASGPDPGPTTSPLASP